MDVGTLPNHVYRLCSLHLYITLLLSCFVLVVLCVCLIFSVEASDCGLGERPSQEKGLGWFVETQQVVSERVLVADC